MCRQKKKGISEEENMGAMKLNLVKILVHPNAKPSFYVIVDESSKSDLKGLKAHSYYASVPVKA